MNKILEPSRDTLISGFSQTVLVCLVLGVMVSCRSGVDSTTFNKIGGPTMGTAYECVFTGTDDEGKFQFAVDSLLDLVNQTASTYIPSSFISEFNSSKEEICLSMDDAKSFHMKTLMSYSADVVNATDGYFDPTLMPLVNYWGFGYKKNLTPPVTDKMVLDSILSFTGFALVQEKINDNAYCLKKNQPHVELDMSAIAKGYAVDLIGQYFNANAIKNYYVNIGGEVITHGRNKEGKIWTLGINYPDTSAGLRELYASIVLDDGAMASSGNYRNYYSSGGKQIAHTINPKTGLATPSDLMGVTIVAKDCATADAYATACMAMGYERARTLVEAHSGLEGFFIYRHPDQAGLSHFATAQLLSQLKFIK